MKKNICYFTCSRTFGGVEKIVIDTTNALTDTFNILVIVPFGCEYKNNFAPEITIYEYTSYDKRYNIFLWLELYTLLKKFKPHIVHTHAAKASQIFHLLNTILKSIHVATKHNIRKGKIFNKIQNVISISKKVASTITHPSKTIYFGIEPLVITPHVNERFTMIAVGRLDPIKGFDKLIEQCAKLEFDFYLEIIGDGPEKENLTKQINQLKLSKKVILAGFQTNIPQKLANAHLHIISSISEGLPITLIEGIYYSNLILSTPVGSIPEILHHDFLNTIDTFEQKINDIHTHYQVYHLSFLQKHQSLKDTLTQTHYINQIKDYYQNLIQNGATQ